MKKRFLAIILAIALAAAFMVPSASAAGIKGVALALGHAHGIALGKNGIVYTWGNNAYGQLGDGTTTLRNVPTPVLNDIVAVSAGGIYRYANVEEVYGKASGHTLAIKSDGTLWAWGENTNGQLGDGTRTQRLKPIQIMTDVVSCAAGGNFSMAVKTDGSLWSWGFNNNGQLGDGTKTTRLSPVKIMDDVAFASGGQNHGLAVKKDGTLWAWGENHCGQLGNGTAIYTNSPIKIMDDVKMASASGVSSSAVKTDGTLWTWGENGNGQLGDGTRISRLAPVKIMDDVSDVALGGTQLLIKFDTGVPDPTSTTVPPATIIEEHTMQVGIGFAIKTDGTLWSWGINSYGQLGNGSTIDQNSPKKIMDNITEVDASGTMGAALSTDGTLYSWGYNENGQLGDGTRADRLTPTKILSDVGVPPQHTGEQAERSKQTVMVNGKIVAFEAYNIGGNNYFKLRDLAMALNGTEEQFSVAYHEETETVGITKNREYTPIGGELSVGTAKDVHIMPSTHKVTIDSIPVMLSAYNINGANYFRLRDLMRQLNVYVGYDGATQTVTIDTSAGYVD